VDEWANEFDGSRKEGLQMLADPTPVTMIIITQSCGRGQHWRMGVLAVALTSHRCDNK
jgi:hypothetical protein